MADKEKKQRSGFDAVEAALAYGGRIYDNAKDFDVAIDHVAGLLDDAALLFERGSFGTATFVAITALEETGKTHVSIYRRDKPEAPPRSRDPLRDHKAKHRMAILPTATRQRPNRCKATGRSAWLGRLERCVNSR